MKGANSMKYNNFYMRSVSTQQLYNFVLTPFQCQFLKEVLEHCDVLEHTAGRKWQMIQLLPSSYNQKRTVQLNYAVLKNIYHARRNHKLDVWHTFCHFIESLPHSELITE
mgnify:CR=1 FL=1